MLFDLKALEALLLRDEGKVGAALDELRQCLRYWERQRHPRWTATTLLQIASVHQASGDARSASQAIARAKELYQQVGDKRGVEECDARVSQYHSGGHVVSVEDYF